MNKIQLTRVWWLSCENFLPVMNPPKEIWRLQKLLHCKLIKVYTVLIWPFIRYHAVTLHKFRWKSAVLCSMLIGFLLLVTEIWKIVITICITDCHHFHWVSCGVHEDSLHPQLSLVFACLITGKAAGVIGEKGGQGEWKAPSDIFDAFASGGLGIYAILADNFHPAASVTVACLLSTCKPRSLSLQSPPSHSCHSFASAICSFPHSFVSPGTRRNGDKFGSGFVVDRELCCPLVWRMVKYGQFLSLMQCLHWLSVV